MGLMDSHILAGSCVLDEVSPKYFQTIINWRNDIENNIYLNQPFVATIDTQNEWYRKYLNGGSQILYVMIDQNMKPFGTIGLKQIDLDKKIAEAGNLLIIPEYRGSIEMAECLVGFYEAAFNHLDVLYGSCDKNNTKVLKLNKNFGFIESEEEFPEQECQKTNANLVDVCIKKDDFYNSKLYKSIKER